MSEVRLWQSQPSRLPTERTTTVKLHFTDHGDIVANLDLLRALADANTQRPRANRAVTIEEWDGHTTEGFNLEGVRDDDIAAITGVIEHPEHGPLPATMDLGLIRSIEFPGT